MKDISLRIGHADGTNTEYSLEQVLTALGEPDAQTLTVSVKKPQGTLTAAICDDDAFPGIDVDGQREDRLYYLANVELPNSSNPEEFVSRLYAGDSEKGIDYPIARVHSLVDGKDDNKKTTVYFDKDAATAKAE